MITGRPNIDSSDLDLPVRERNASTMTVECPSLIVTVDVPSHRKARPGDSLAWALEAIGKRGTVLHPAGTMPRSKASEIAAMTRAVAIRSSLIRESSYR